MTDRRHETRRIYEELQAAATDADAAGRDVNDGEADGDDAPDDEMSRVQRSEQQALWVDIQVRQAMSAGEFDDLPGSGKPIRGLGGTHDPEWWVKQKLEREQITGLGPPALLLRREDSELDGRLDRETTEAGVRRVVEDFNRRVVEARRQLLGGPPVITATRDADREVANWRERIVARKERQRAALADGSDDAGDGARTVENVQGRRRWWRRGP